MKKIFWVFILSLGFTDVSFAMAPGRGSGEGSGTNPSGNSSELARLRSENADLKNRIILLGRANQGLYQDSLRLKERLKALEKELDSLRPNTTFEGVILSVNPGPNFVSCAGAGLTECAIPPIDYTVFVVVMKVSEPHCIGGSETTPCFSADVEKTVLIRANDPDSVKQCASKMLDRLNRKEFTLGTFKGRSVVTGDEGPVLKEIYSCSM